MGKLHCLQLSARQLSLVNRMKLINIISRLSKVPAARNWNGRILFGIFRKYAPEALVQCYRTLWTQNISRYSLINYGLNDPSSFLIEEKNFMDQSLYQQAKSNLVAQMLNQYTNKGYVASTPNFAKPIHDKPLDGKPRNTLDPNTPIKDNTVKPGTTTPTPAANNKPTTPGGGQDNKPGGAGGTAPPNMNGDIVY